MLRKCIRIYGKVATMVAVTTLASLSSAQTVSQSSLQVSIAKNGTYSITSRSAHSVQLRAGVAAQIDGHWVHSAEYPHAEVTESSGSGPFGAAHRWQVRSYGLQGQPELLYRLRAYENQPFADLQVTVHNSTGRELQVQEIRAVEATDPASLTLGGNATDERVLSDSFSEDRPAMKIHELADSTHGMHRGVGSQLLYNRGTRQSLFLGALSSDKFLTVLRLHVDGSGNHAHVARYEVDSTGTTELELDNSLANSSAEDCVTLSLPVAPGAELSSEPLAISIAGSPQDQLEAYGETIRELHHPRTSAPPLLGWWSWTAYYFGLNDGAALTNAQWEAEHLKPYGYNVFHIDEGYQYARGEYTTPNATLFPQGLVPLEQKADALGLLPGIWTAPFEVSERAWVYQHHPEWLVKNAAGKPIRAGFVVDGKDQLYVLDVTNPEAQAYLHQTYAELVQRWGIRYIKLDFMDDSAIEGFYFKPHTTAMEAQRLGLQTIRDAVGQHVYLDKDGSVMLNPVGYVDYGRLSQDTGHSFDASRDAATGMAARFFMNHNYFIADPDAFTVSRQRINDQSWHEGKAPLTLDEARVSMTLAAVSGGMLEIGDNLPSLEGSPDRVALLENRDLLDMVRLGKAAKPLDLMTYSPEDGQPSLFCLKETNAQTMLAVFDWTEHATTHLIDLRDLGLNPGHRYAISDVLDNQRYTVQTSGMVGIKSESHTVHLLKIVDQEIPPAAPEISIEGPTGVQAGESSLFVAQGKNDNPAASYAWDFGDGVHLEGARASHAWTEPGDYVVRLTATGVNALQKSTELHLHVTGYLPSTFDTSKIRRPESQ